MMMIEWTTRMRMVRLAFGIQFALRHRIIFKLEKAGATSEDKAVTIEEAKFDMSESRWLTYFAGVFMSKVKKTTDQRYYI